MGGRRERDAKASKQGFAHVRFLPQSHGDDSVFRCAQRLRQPQRDEPVAAIAIRNAPTSLRVAINRVIRVILELFTKAVCRGQRKVKLLGFACVVAFGFDFIENEAVSAARKSAGGQIFFLDGFDAQGRPIRPRRV
jgi:hypothetical protein